MTHAADAPSPCPTHRTTRTKRTAALLLAAASVAAMLSTATASSAATAAPAAASSRYGTPLSPRLQDLAETSSGSASQRSLKEGLGTDDTGRIYVDVVAPSGAAIAPAAAAVGATIEATTPEGEAATLAISVSQLEALSRQPGLQAIHEVPEPRIARVGGTDPRTDAPARTAAALCPSGTTVSSGSAQLGVPLARSTYGVDGTGVKIGIISDSFGVDSRAVATDIKAGNLPGTGNPCGHTTPVQIIADGAGRTDEGRAMAQIVHDLAPGASLLFADSGSSQIEMANHIRALRDAGARVIVDDIAFGDETMYQDGYIAAAVNEVTADGVAYYSAAGNSNLFVGGKSVGSYEAMSFRSAPCPAAIDVEEMTCHDFDPNAGVTTKNGISVPAGGSVEVSLGWNEATYDVKTDLDLYLLDDATGEILAASDTDSIGYGRPVEWLPYENEGSSTKKVRLVVARYDGTTTPRFKTIFYTPGLSAVQWNANRGTDVVGPTLYGHSGGTTTFSVAAMNDHAAPSIEDFSSRGPATYCWEQVHGSTPSPALPACTTKTIDILGTDGVTTTVSGFAPFYGTSAAAPHIAAMGALLIDHAPCTTPGAVADAIRASGSGPIDDAGGHGQPDASGAVQALAACGGTLAPAPTPTVTSVGADTVKLTVRGPSAAPSDPFGHEVQVLSPGGQVVSTHTFGPAGVSSPSMLVTVPVEAGHGYRFRSRANLITEWSPWSTSTALIVPPFGSFNAFANRLGTDFAGRSLVPIEREVFTFLVAEGWGPEAAVVEASLFEEWSPKVDPVIRLYYAYFQRKPDTSGLNYWLGKRRAGTTLDRISSTFADSSEFKRKYGSLSNNAFVKLVYQNVLGRPGDASGIAYWTKQLDTRKKNRGQVMTGFSESSEHLRRRVGEYLTIDLYFGLLRRVPTTAEMTTWVPQVKDYDGALALVSAILSSAEYVDRVS